MGSYERRYLDGRATLKRPFLIYTLSVYNVGDQGLFSDAIPPVSTVESLEEYDALYLTRLLLEECSDLVSRRAVYMIILRIVACVASWEKARGC